MKPYVLEESEKYTIKRHLYRGISVTRKRDGASVFFQMGADANAFEDELEAALRAEETGTLPSDTNACDVVCEQYDEVMV